jgi:hypothetical protein
LRPQLFRLLASIAVERGDLEVALDFAHRALCLARADYARDPTVGIDLPDCLKAEASILESLGRLDEAVALDAEWVGLKSCECKCRWSKDVLVRRAMKHIAAGEDAEAEEILRDYSQLPTRGFHELHTSKTIEAIIRPHMLLAELLERRGTKEALAEARTLRDAVLQQQVMHEANKAAALEETRAAAAEAVRQWRGERVKAREQQEGGKKKAKGKKERRKGKGKGKGASSAAAAIEGERPPEPAGGGAEGVAAIEGAAAAEPEQQPHVAETKPRREEEEDEREECAICLQDLELEDDGDPWGDEGGEGKALVVLTCGHRFHEMCGDMCGDMWCAKCADQGWSVTCPRCRAPYVLVRR